MKKPDIKKYTIISLNIEYLLKTLRFRINDFSGIASSNIHFDGKKCIFIHKSACKSQLFHQFAQPATLIDEGIIQLFHLFDFR